MKIDLDLTKTKIPTKKTNEMKYRIFLPERLAVMVDMLFTTCKYRPEFVVMSMLTVFSVAIGKRYKLKLKELFSVYCNVFIIICGPPNCGKTHPMALMVRPLKKRNREYHEQFLIQKREYDQYMSTPKEERDGALSVAAPRAKQIVLSDITKESMLDVLNNNQEGILLNCDEIAGLFRNMGRYSTKGSDIETYLELWSNSQQYINRKNSDPIMIDEPFVSVLGGIQPSILSDVYDTRNTSNGACDRFDTVFAKNVQPIKWEDAEPNKQMIDNYERIIFTLLDRPIIEINGQIEPIIIEFTLEAKQRLYEWRNGQHYDDLESFSVSLLANAMGKMDIKILKYILILHIMFYETGEIRTEKVDVRIVEAAIVLIEYLKGEVEQAHRLVFEKDSLFILDSKHQSIYEQLPEKFKRKDGIAIALANGMPQRTFQRFIAKDDLFERIEHGYYNKRIKPDEF